MQIYYFSPSSVFLFYFADKSEYKIVVIKKNNTCLTLAQVCPSQSLFGSAEAQLPTHYAGSCQVPQVITHRPPFSLFQNLHTSLSNPGTCFQTHCLLKHAEKDFVRKCFKSYSENTKRYWRQKVDVQNEKFRFLSLLLISSPLHICEAQHINCFVKKEISSSFSSFCMEMQMIAIYDIGKYIILF